jgi:hypothetical protein
MNSERGPGITPGRWAVGWWAGGREASPPAIAAMVAGMAGSATMDPQYRQIAPRLLPGAIKGMVASMLRSIWRLGGREVRDGP